MTTYGEWRTNDEELGKLRAQIELLHTKPGDILSIVIGGAIPEKQLRAFRRQLGEKLKPLGVLVLVLNGDIKVELHRPTTAKVEELEQRLACLENELAMSGIHGT